MSELTQCNFCSFKQVEQDARRRGMKVTLLPAKFGLGGVDVLVHSPDIKVDSKISKEVRDNYFCAWYMELPDHCCC